MDFSSFVSILRSELGELSILTVTTEGSIPTAILFGLLVDEIGESNALEVKNLAISEYQRVCSLLYAGVSGVKFSSRISDHHRNHLEGYPQNIIVDVPTDHLRYWLNGSQNFPFAVPR